MDHGSIPYFYGSHGSPCILKNGRKIQNSDGETDNAIAFVALRSAETI